MKKKAKFGSAPSYDLGKQPKNIKNLIVVTRDVEKTAAFEVGISVAMEKNCSIRSIGATLGALSGAGLGAAYAEEGNRLKGALGGATMGGALGLSAGHLLKKSKDAAKASAKKLSIKPSGPSKTKIEPVDVMAKPAPKWTPAGKFQQSVEKLDKSIKAPMDNSKQIKLMEGWLNKAKKDLKEATPYPGAEPKEFVEQVKKYEQGLADIKAGKMWP